MSVVPAQPFVPPDGPALNAGADDYCVKPLRAEEFCARIAALQRRSSFQIPEISDGELFPGYVFDPATRQVQVDGVQVTLTEKEFELSRLLFSNLDRPLARGRIMLEVWGRDEAALSRTLDVHISWIRRKLNIGADATRVRIIQALRAANPDLPIAVDGGVSEENAGAIVADDFNSFDDLFYIAGALHGNPAALQRRQSAGS